MLTQEVVQQKEEALSQQINKLSDEKRKAFYTEAKKRIKDPDTYAALNWFFVCGIHHFYLGKIGHGLLDLLVFIAGIALVIAGQVAIGLTIIAILSALELWALFRSQIIIQDWNNQVYEELLRKIDP